MKTKEGAAKEYQTKIYEDVFEEGSLSEQKLQCINDFKAGIAFAEEWINVDKEPIPKGETVLFMYDNDPKRIASGFADKTDGSACPHWRGDGWIKATSWRPINRK